jgi:hypothetical protein
VTNFWPRLRDGEGVEKTSPPCVSIIKKQITGVIEEAWKKWGILRLVKHLLQVILDRLSFQTSSLKIGPVGV